MKWNYESLCWLEKRNKDNFSLFKPLTFGVSVMRSYTMWSWHQNEFDFSFENRSKFLKEHYLESSDNFLLDLLKSDIDKEEQAVLIAFYYLKDDEIRELEQNLAKAKEEVKILYEEVKVEYHKRENILLERLKDPNFMKRLVNASFPLDITIVHYISLVDSYNMSLNYEKDQGVIIALGYEFELDESIVKYDHKETLDKLKALGDETRLRIIELIIEKPLSASELSVILNLTIPTIAHHLKVLASSSLIGVCVQNEGDSKVNYKVYNEGFGELIKNLNILNQEG